MKRLINKIKATFDKHKIVVNVVKKTATEATKLNAPVIGISIEAVKTIFENLNEVQCKMIFEGLKKSENVEKRINQLYVFSKKKEGAVIISRLGEQAAHSKSTKALVILGIMLSECMETEAEPSYEDMIVMSALQAATDYEIEYMKDIYDNYIDEDGIINVKKISKSSLAEEYMQTLEWAKVNRVIGKTDYRNACEFEIFGEFLVVNKNTEKFIYYILAAKQVLDYKM